MMEAVYVALAILLTCFVLVGIFILGMLFMRAIVHDEQREARYDMQMLEYYRLANVQRPSDPRPYVPPRPVTPRARNILPGLDKIGRMMKEGKRGTVMWRAGDRKSAE